MEIGDKSKALFWAKVQKTDSCWEWTGSRMKSYGTRTLNYGRLTIAGRRYLAHRVSFFLTHGTWPTNNALHICDNPPCVRPDHIVDGTQQENVLDAMSKGRWDHSTIRNGLTCKAGHSYARFEYIRPDGKGRDCKACKNAASTRYHRSRSNAPQA